MASRKNGMLLDRLMYQARYLIGYLSNCQIGLASHKESEPLFNMRNIFWLRIFCLYRLICREYIFQIRAEFSWGLALDAPQAQN